MKRYLCFIFVFFISHFANAQTSNIQFESVALPADADTNQVTCFLQTNDGFLWMGTRDGLIRYDGYTSSKITASLDGNDSFSFGDVHSLIEVESGIIWIASQNGLYIYNDILCIAERFSGLKDESLSYRSLFETKSGTIVMGTNKGLFIYDPATKKISSYKHRKGFSKSISNNTIRCVYEDSDGVLWVGTYDKLNKMDRERGTFSSYRLKQRNKSDLLQNNLILSISEVEKNGKNILLVGTETGLVFFNRESADFKVVEQGDSSSELSNSVIKSIEVVNPNEIWLGTDMGLNIYDVKENKFRKYYADYNNSYTITNNIIPSIFKDSKGNVWIASDNGVDKTFIGGGDFFYNQLSKGTSYFDKTEKVTSVTQDSYGNHWFGTRDGFCSYNNKTQKYKWFKLPGFLSTKIGDIIIDKKGEIWLATPQGLHIYNPQKKTYRSYYSDKNNPEALQTNYINSLFEDRNGNVWIGTYGGGVYKAEVSNNEYIKFTHIVQDIETEEKLTNMSIFNIVGGSGDDLWVSSNHGLKQINIVSGEIKPFKTGSFHVQAMVLEDDQFLWFAYNRKIYKYDIYTQDLHEISAVIGEVRSLVVSEEGIWFCTFRNMFHMNKDGTQLEQVSSKLTRMSNYGRNSFKNSNGDFIFAGTSGYIAFNPSKIKVDTTVNTVQFTNLKVLNDIVYPSSSLEQVSILKKSINNVDKLEFEYEENTFSFEFSTLNYYNQENEKYRYILEGYESKWQEVSGKQHFAPYTRVKPGTYVFKVKAANASGVFIDEYRSLNITVHPPIWASNWAIAIYGILIFIFLIISRRLLISRVNDINSLDFEKLQRVKSDELISSKTRFFTNISHELKTPLTLILSPTERLLKEENDERKIATLEIIKRNTERLIRLVNQVLDLRKIESGNEKLTIERYDLIRFSKKIVSLFEEEAAYRNIKLNFSSEVEILDMNFDMTKVEKVIFNLISNAFKFTQDYGHIKLKITIVKKKSKTYVCITVKDNGIGISEENQKLIFDRFTNIKTTNFTSQEGTGIGLSLVQDYVDLHKGFIKLKSKEEKGSSFSIHLPIAMPSDMKNEDISGENNFGNLNENDLSYEEEEENEGSGKLRLLVVEDDRDMRSFIKSMFESDYDLILASDGQEGYEKTFVYHPDIIISDVMMPRMDGITLCKKLKSDIRTSHIPLILLTAKAGIENQMEGIGVGADDYIQKPFHLDYLLLRTKMLISKREKVQKNYLKEEQLVSSEITSNPIDEKFLNDLISVIEKQLDNSDLSVKLLAEFLQMDKTSLYRKVKSLTGQTAIAFIRNTRLKKAAQLLKNDNLNVSEVMYMVGYTHRSYFTRSFKELFGMVPTEYKTKSKN
tara:strand:- start:34082 stop:38119 length:4038 start_codon:yes stop_codon:yes gene_type:complete